jgi:hypothetical protein
MPIILSILAIAISLVTITIATAPSRARRGDPPVATPPATPPPPPPDTIAAYLPIEPWEPYPAITFRTMAGRWQRFWVSFFFGVTWQPYPPARLPLWGTDTTSQDAPCRPSASPEKTS